MGAQQEIDTATAGAVAAKGTVVAVAAKACGDAKPWGETADDTESSASPVAVADTSVPADKAAADKAVADKAAADKAAADRPDRAG